MISPMPAAAPTGWSGSPTRRRDAWARRCCVGVAGPQSAAV